MLRITMPIIEIQKLVKIYPLDEQEVIGLAGLDLTIEEGEFVAIMGPSGSGKSTLLYILGGLDTATDGSVKVAGHSLESLDSEELAAFRRETIGYVFQSFHLVPTITAIENVALPGIFARIPQDERLERAWKLLSMLGMEDRLEHLPKQLSGGQQQRVAIARALFNDPPILMADEPTGSLDSKTGETVLKMLRNLATQRKKTIIVVTHDTRIARYADRVLTLRDGKIVGRSRLPHND
jgi:ABC-type lipoprotein export system ATPase subunit